ncbi:MAG: hydrogenase maturation protease [Rhodoferax sp.]
MTLVPEPVAPLLVFGWGNLSRGDDALGPLLIERLRALAGPTTAVDFLDDYQLQIEHALDLVGRQRVLFVDASLSCRAPFEATPLQAAPDCSFSTHALSPQALLKVFCDLRGQAPPPCTLLAIRGERFGLGAPPSMAALAHLAAALAWASDWLAGPAAVHRSTGD